MTRIYIRKENYLRDKVAEVNGCWLWLGKPTPSGYGAAGGIPAHRVMYEMLVGPIPKGMVLDHLCKMRLCVRPEHLEPVTVRENLMRSPTFQALNAAKTECVNGHPFDEENTRHFTRNGYPRRGCRACDREHARKQRERAKISA